MSETEKDNRPAPTVEREGGPVAPTRLSTRVSSHRNASDLIPLEVIESWLKGEYLVGITQSTGYQYIGWSLLLRGFYEYRNNVDGKIAHWGYCYIDLKDGDLYYAGVRINSGAEWKLQEVNHPIYWRSVFSKFVGLESETYPRLYFGYIAHMLKNEPAGSPVSYQDYCQHAGDEAVGFFEWYFKTTRERERKGPLPPMEEARLKGMNQFWQEACRAMNRDTLPIKPNEKNIEPFRRMVLNYLADRDKFDSDLALLEQLHQNQEILALVNLNLRTIENGALKATLQPLTSDENKDLHTGFFEFERREQPLLD